MYSKFINGAMNGQTNWRRLSKENAGERVLSSYMALKPA